MHFSLSNWASPHAAIEPMRRKQRITHNYLELFDIDSTKVPLQIAKKRLSMPFTTKRFFYSNTQKLIAR